MREIDCERQVVLGIDPGTAIMGYGIVAQDSRDVSLVTYGVLRTSSDLPPHRRLRLLYQGLARLIEQYRPDEVAVEELYFSSNVRTALAVGQARGIALLAAADYGLRVAEYSPQHVKQAIAVYGRARKAQVQQMVAVLLGLAAVPEPDDAADALALAICHLHSSAADAFIKATAASGMEAEG